MSRTLLLRHCAEWLIGLAVLAIPAQAGQRSDRVYYRTESTVTATGLPTCRLLVNGGNFTLAVVLLPNHAMAVLFQTFRRMPYRSEIGIGIDEENHFRAPGYFLRRGLQMETGMLSNNADVNAVFLKGLQDHAAHA